MPTRTAELVIRTSGPGLYAIGDQVGAVVASCAADEGLCTVFVAHTSASVLIQENADPDVRRDLDAFFRRLVPEGDPLFTHNDEGPDDMPAHIKAALTAASVSIPIVGGRMVLGMWQGIYLWEHRRDPHARRVIVSVTS